MSRKEKLYVIKRRAIWSTARHKVAYTLCEGRRDLEFMWNHRFENSVIMKFTKYEANKLISSFEENEKDSNYIGPQHYYDCVEVT